MGGRSHWCVADLGASGAGGQQCACGRVVVQRNDIRVARDAHGQPVDWQEWDADRDERWWCRPCLRAYRAYLEANGWTAPRTRPER